MRWRWWLRAFTKWECSLWRADEYSREGMSSVHVLSRRRPTAKLLYDSINCHITCSSSPTCNLCGKEEFFRLWVDTCGVEVELFCNIFTETRTCSNFCGDNSEDSEFGSENGWTSHQDGQLGSAEATPPLKKTMWLEIWWNLLSETAWKEYRTVDVQCCHSVGNSMSSKGLRVACMEVWLCNCHCRLFTKSQQSVLHFIAKIKPNGGRMECSGCSFVAMIFSWRGSYLPKTLKHFI